MLDAETMEVVLATGVVVETAGVATEATVALDVATTATVVVGFTTTTDDDVLT